MLMIRLDLGTKGAWQKMSKELSMEKSEDEATDGDGVVTMNTHENINGSFYM